MHACIIILINIGDSAHARDESRAPSAPPRARRRAPEDRERLCTRHLLRHVRLSMHALAHGRPATQPSQPAESALSAERHLGYIRVFSVVHTWT